MLVILDRIVIQRFFIVERGIGPDDIFKSATNGCTSPAPRWVHKDSAGNFAVLVFTDGSAPNNGQENVRAGCGIVFRPDGRGGVSFPLENVPGYRLTSNRAELRAAQVALGLRYWPGEGFTRVVIGTDSEYVVRGASEWYRNWRANGWMTSRGTPVENRDLWEMLLKAIEDLESSTFSVQFYLLKREWNTEADACAKRGAEMTDVPTQFGPIYAVDV